MYSVFDYFFHINSGNADAWDAVGLLVLLRLWRIVRIANGETNVQILYIHILHVHGGDF